MLTGVHFLLSYACTFECDHCFLYCSPRASGTFTIAQMRDVFGQIDDLGTVNNVFFEGGEPFLYYAHMLEGLRLAKARKLSTGIVTNAYWATSAEDAEYWLKPLIDIGIDTLSLSDDAFHQPEEGVNTAKNALDAATTLGMPVGAICIEGPAVTGETSAKGEPVIGGDVRFRGRAADKLTDGLPRKPLQGFTSCDDEELRHPKRVHIDSYGNVHLCQGVVMGNMWQVPLKKMITEFDADRHPVCGPLLAGGPAKLAETYGVDVGDEFVDACHACYEIRKALIDRFPEALAPRQVFGLE